MWKNIKNYENIYLCSNAVYDKDNCILPFIYPEQLPGAKGNWDGIGSLNGKTKNNYYEKNRTFI